jgi:hypothetical protein
LGDELNFLRAEKEKKLARAGAGVEIFIKHIHANLRVYSSLICSWKHKKLLRKALE